MDFVLVSITIIVIGIAASWYPAKRASVQDIELKAT
jgi:lipoprotein-releasing system permease protein